MLEAKQSNAANLSLTSSTSLDDSCDSYSADYEEGCSRPSQCGSSDYGTPVKQQPRPHSLSSSLLMQQATSKIKQRRRAGTANAVARSKILASYNINAVDRDDGGKQQQRSSNPNSNKQQARIPSTVFKYMSKCEGSGRSAAAAARGNDAAGDANDTNADAAADAAAVSAAVSAYDATATRDVADKSKGEPAVEPGPDDAVDEAPKQKTAAVEPQQVGCTKNATMAENDANKSNVEPIGEPRPNDAVDEAPSQTTAAVKPQQVGDTKNATVAEDDANKSKGEPAVEPRPNDATDEEPSQTTAAVKPQQVGGTKNATESQDDANKSEGVPAVEPRPNDAMDEEPSQTAAAVRPQQVDGVKKIARNCRGRPSKPSASKDEKPVDGPAATLPPPPPPPGPPPKVVAARLAASKAAARPAASKAAARPAPGSRKEKAMARMRRTKDERNKEATRRRQRAEGDVGADVGGAETGGVRSSSNKPEGENAADPLPKEAVAKERVAKASSGGLPEFICFDVDRSDRNEEAAAKERSTVEHAPRHHRHIAGLGSASNPFSKFVYSDDGGSARDATSKEAGGDVARRVGGRHRCANSGGTRVRSKNICR